MILYSSSERERDVCTHKRNEAHSDVAILLPSYVQTHSIHKDTKKRDDGMECWSASFNREPYKIHLYEMRANKR